MKPIGYYVSVPEGHEDYETLKTLEFVNGSYFEIVSLSELWAMLYWCSVAMPRELKQNDSKLLCQLSSQTCFDLIPFLYQVIKERMNNGN